ncbi:hypothetical protein [Streptomyces sp. PTD5-9]|uniref:hypothetical protein n=1 Tax=Streptomyces sp. PTD5-9 TaxID=3120150 RepID=UPI003008DD75
MAASPATTAAKPESAAPDSTTPDSAMPGGAMPEATEPEAVGPGSVKPRSAAEDGRPGCADPGEGASPIRVRVHGGSGTYASGGGYGSWFLDLTNTTNRTCRAVHPVLVLVDEERRLTPEQIQVVFSEPDRPDMEHRVSWRTVDGDEHIGVLGGGSPSDGEGDGAGEDDGTAVGTGAFGGFTVPAGRTVTVRIRMAFTSDTRPGRFTAGAAIARRAPASDGGTGTVGGRDEDDERWGAASGGYSFAIVDDGESEGGAGDGRAGPDRGPQPRRPSPRPGA